MIYIGYLVSAVILIICSVKSAKYVDFLDKNTRLSGAFLGGILISAVTSIPELVTSLAAMAYNRPNLAIGDVLGSNFFNLVVLAVATLFFMKGFCKGMVSKSYRNVLKLVLIIYLLIVLHYFGQIEGGIFHLSITSILIVVIYIFGAKYLSIANDVNTDEDLLSFHATTTTSLTTRQISLRFAASALGVILFGIAITSFTVGIMGEHALEEELAGAVFLGISTSLPEVIFVITLFKMKNFNIGVGNIIGSNLFNFLILAAVDMISVRRGVYGALNFEGLQLLILGLVATMFQYLILKKKNKNTAFAGSVGIIVCYILFLFI